MFRKASSLFVASLIALGLVSGGASAQTGPVGPIQNVPTTNNVQPQQGQVLTEQTLPQMLQAAGHQYQEIVNPTNGSKTWKLNLTNNGWRFEINIELIKNNGQYQGYGLSSQLAKLDSNPSVAMAQMEKVLAHNFGFIGAYRFAYDKTSRMIVMVQDIFDTKMNVQLLRDDITRFMNEVQRTFGVWSPNAPTTQPAPVVNQPVVNQPVVNPPVVNPNPNANPFNPAPAVNQAPQNLFPAPQPTSNVQPISWVEA